MTKKVYRDAETGQWVSETYVEQHPDTTVTETVELDEYGDRPTESNDPGGSTGRFGNGNL